MLNQRNLFLCLFFAAIFLFITPLFINPVSADYSCSGQSVGTINASGIVKILNCNVSGNVTVTNGVLSISGNSQIAGNITTSEAYVIIDSNTIAGNINITTSSGDNKISGNTVSGSVIVNGGTLRVTFNTITGDLTAICPPTQVLEANNNNVSGTTNLCGFGPSPTPTPTSGPTNTPTPTPTQGAIAGPATPTPTPGQWYKIKNASFYKYTDLINQLPATVNSYGAEPDDTGERLFDIEDAGVVAAAGANIYFGEQTGECLASSTCWRIANYPKSTHMTSEKFLLRVKSFRPYVTITSINDVQRNKINVISGSPVISNNGIEAQSPFVLIVDGDVTIDIGNQFNPSEKSIAILSTRSTTFNISSNVEEINGIFIGKSVNFVSNIVSTINPLKIKGNIIASDDMATPPDTAYKRNRVDQTKPSIFSILDVAHYIELLPYLSTNIYEYTELTP